MKKVRDAIPESGGIQVIIAKRCKVSEAAMTKFLQKYPHIKEEIIKEKELDVAEVRHRRRDIAIHSDEKLPITWNCMKSILMMAGEHAEKSEDKTKLETEGVEFITIYGKSEDKVGTERKTEDSVEATSG